ncbi:LicD family-domain-containing protein [Obelidium mucronatum]|nr:LicD family-domain-containing protein [Obelidium mucronatum]
MLRNQSLAAKDFQLLSRVAKFDTKYFQESGVDMKLDSRFLEEQEESTNATSSSSTTYYKRRYDYDMMHTSLVSLLRVWSNFCSERGFVWWIAHGPLLGWLWNQKLLPWDPDLDIQVSLTQLIQLIPFNQTMMNDRFLLDMTPNIYYRLPQSMNAIDARLIDTKTGFMLDITALAVTNSAEEPTKISCKKPHSYSYDSIMPLYETELEGIRVYRPNHVLGILKVLLAI